MIKQIFKITLAIALAIGITACNGHAEPKSQETKVQSIIKKGELVLGTSGNMTPMTRAIDDGKSAVGFDIDLAESIASTMGVKLVVKVMPLNELVTAVSDGSVDIVISNMTMTPERNTKVTFVGPYLTSGKCIVTQAPDLATATKEDLNASQKRIAVILGSTSENFVNMVMPGVTPVAVNTQEDAISLVRDQKAAAFLTDYPVCKAVISNNPDDKFISVFSNLTYEPIGIAIAPQNTHLQNWTENYLVRAENMGLLQALANKWFR